MRRLVSLTIALLAALASAACSPKPPIHSADYYLSHPVERDDRMAACQAMGDDRAKDADCVNAGKAWLASWGVRPVIPAAVAEAASAPSATPQ